MSKVRTEKEAALAAPVTLPAGSYDMEALQKALDDAVAAKSDAARDKLRGDAVAKAKETDALAAQLLAEVAEPRIERSDVAEQVAEKQAPAPGKSAASPKKGSNL